MDYQVADQTNSELMHDGRTKRRKVDRFGKKRTDEPLGGYTIVKRLLKNVTF
ncbi:hypothetical protein DPMN_032070 [Dreissena polymorpha]|uniref:Uncharacterized protein n=1 Tax=Dreissena polymorpha TaxID=45954 RepID=A0A9D4M3Z5_DREPO|nr:hypothetical protein DPMN_032070 [Dreissena polymorpha]